VHCNYISPYSITCLVYLNLKLIFIISSHVIYIYIYIYIYITWHAACILNCTRPIRTGDQFLNILCQVGAEWVSSMSKFVTEVTCVTTDRERHWNALEFFLFSSTKIVDRFWLDELSPTQYKKNSMRNKF